MRLRTQFQSISLKYPYFKRVVAYFLFFIFVSLFFVVARFPTDSLVPVIKHAVSSNTPFKVAFSESSFMFPPGFMLKNITLLEPLPTKNRQIITLERLTLNPSIISAFFGKPSATLSAKMLGGSFDFYGETETGDTGDIIKTNFTLNNMDPGRALFWNDFPWAKLNGVINGEGNINFSFENPIKNSGGKITLNMGKGNLSIAKAILPDAQAISLSKGEAIVSIKSGVIFLEKCEITGAEVTVALTGTIVMAQLAQNSRLGLTASIKLRGKLKEKLAPFTSFFKKDKTGATMIKIGGTLASPAAR